MSHFSSACLPTPRPEMPCPSQIAARSSAGGVHPATPAVGDTELPAERCSLRGPRHQGARGPLAALRRRCSEKEIPTHTEALKGAGECVFAQRRSIGIWAQQAFSIKTDSTSVSDSRVVSAITTQLSGESILHETKESGWTLRNVTREH